MEEMIDSIVEKVSFEKKDKFKKLLQESIRIVRKRDKDKEDSPYESVAFKLDVLFQGFSPFINHFGKDKKYESGVEALSAICEVLELGIDRSECFIIFHIRELGKFRMKESTLLEELRPLWSKYKAYKLEGVDFSYSLKNLMKYKFIAYRKGNLHLNSTIMLRYIFE